jgi:hypothetical protein
MISVLSSTASRPAQSKNPHQLKGKMYPAPVDGQVSLSGVFATSLLKRDVPLQSSSIIQNGRLGLTFRQLDEMSRRVARIIAAQISLISPGEREAPSNSDGDAVVALLSEGSEVDERMIVLILAILKLGATFISIRIGRLESESDWTWIIRQTCPLLVVITDSTTVPYMIKTSNVIRNKIKLPHQIWTAEELWTEALKLPFDQNNDISVAPLRTRIPPGERIAGIFPMFCVPFMKSRFVRISHRYSKLSLDG